jgi:2,3-bisphosphoglycerate-independent phosphoglycerate mutase
MSKILFLFLDGVGLGENDPGRNPFAQAAMPNLQNLLGGQRMVASAAPLESSRATLLALDANLGVPGLPQSASGQAALLSGQNVPAILGYHYGPKPNQAVADMVVKSNLFKHLKDAGLRVAFLNAFPDAYFEAIGSGHRLYGTIALAAVRAGVPLYTVDDLRQGRAISADFTAQGWRDRLGYKDTPLIEPAAAGRQLAAQAGEFNFSLFEYWLTDYAGHEQDMAAACDLLVTFDQVLGGLLDTWDDRSGLLLITSDHGNLEDLSTHRHTSNPVPLLLVGAEELRRQFAAGLRDLAGIAPAIERCLLKARPG